MSHRIQKTSRLATLLGLVVALIAVMLTASPFANAQGEAKQQLVDPTVVADAVLTVDEVPAGSCNFEVSVTSGSTQTAPFDLVIVGDYVVNYPAGLAADQTVMHAVTQPFTTNEIIAYTWPSVNGNGDQSAVIGESCEPDIAVVDAVVDGCAVNYSIDNLGGTVAGNVASAVYRNGVFSGNVQLPDMEADDDPVELTTGNFAPGDVIEVRALSSFAQTSFENNSSGLLTIPNPCAPDLSVAVVDPVGDCNFDIVVANVGGDIAPSEPGPFGAGGNWAILGTDVPGLTTGGFTTSFDVAWPFYGPNIVAHVTPLANDADPDNNNVTFAIPDACLPDLAIVNPVVDECAVVYDVTNLGGSAAPFGLALVNPGETISTSTSVLAPGPVTVSVPEFDVELDTANNYFSTVIEPGCDADVDLAIDVVENADAVCSFDVVVTNAGATTSEATIASMGWQSTSVDAGLANSASQVVFTVSAPFGAHTIDAQVAALEFEAMTSNNTVVFEIPDSCLSDLIVDEIVVADCSAYFVVRNVGARAMGGPATGRVVDDAGYFWEFTIDDLAPGATWASDSITIGEASNELFYFGADSGLALAESDELTGQVVSELISTDNCKVAEAAEVEAEGQRDRAGRQLAEGASGESKSLPADTEDVAQRGTRAVG